MCGWKRITMAALPQRNAMANHHGPAVLADFSSGMAAVLWPATGIMLAGWLVLSGALLAARAALGATRPLAWWQFALATCAALATALLSHVAVNWPRGAHGRPMTVLVCHFLTSGGLLAWSSALLAGGSPLFAAMLCMSLIGVEAWAWRGFVARRQAERIGSPTSAAAERLVQQLTRTQTAAGEETIQGSAAVRIEQGGRMGAAHIAFCPPFAERPQFEARLTDPHGGTLKVAQLYAHGARVEVRLPHAAAADACFVVRFAARVSALEQFERGP